MLFGSLSAALIGLLITAVNLVGARPSPAASPPADEEVRPQPAVRRRAQAPRALPSVMADPCTPKPGWACWRGRLNLTPAVRSAWQAARAAAREPMESPDPVLPPDGSFASFFDVRLIPRTDEQTSEAADGSVTTFSDGTFVAQVPPGRYDVEVISHDGILIGGADDLRAIAGATEAGLALQLDQAVALQGRVIDEDGLPASETVSATRRGRSEMSLTSVGDDGEFRIEGLRPGRHLLSATTGKGDEHVDLEVMAPASGIELRLPRPTDALLLFPPSSDGKCPRVDLKLTAEADAQDQPRRRVRSVGCTALVHDVPPGSAWTLSGLVAGQPLQRQIRFDTNRPPTPLCLDFPCDPFVAVSRSGSSMPTETASPVTCASSARRSGG